MVFFTQAVIDLNKKMQGIEREVAKRRCRKPKENS
jgi:hypothetical protein